jgi:DNA-binding HxlR family transcriptional regulator
MLIYNYLMEHRSYRQFCALASALDVIGERWTLLIIRELLAGPRRFKDLMDGLPDISTNLLSERLRGLEQQGMLRRRALPPPAGSTVYQLTPLGSSLEKPVLELGKWGSQFLPSSLEGVAVPSLGAISLAIKAFFHPEQALEVNETYEIHLDDEVLQVHVEAGEIKVRQGEAQTPDVAFHTSMELFVGLFAGRIKPDEAISTGIVQIDGDPAALSRFLRLSGVPATN